MDSRKSTPGTRAYGFIGRAVILIWHGCHKGIDGPQRLECPFYDDDDDDDDYAVEEPHERHNSAEVVGTLSPS